MKYYIMREVRYEVVGKDGYTYATFFHRKDAKKWVRDQKRVNQK